MTLTISVLISGPGLWSSGLCITIYIVHAGIMWILWVRFPGLRPLARHLITHASSVDKDVNGSLVSRNLSYSFFCLHLIYCVTILSGLRESHCIDEADGTQAHHLCEGTHCDNTQVSFTISYCI